MEAKKELSFILKVIETKKVAELDTNMSSILDMMKEISDKNQLMYPSKIIQKP